MSNSSVGASRRRARRQAISAGKVRVDGAVASKPGAQVSAAVQIDAEKLYPWASRGGLKLAQALDVFGLHVSGQHCLDIGSSTGGFTDVLLGGGARRVVGVEVGVGQLHPRLRADSRVVLLESTDARSLNAAMVIEPPTVIVCDVSFISLSKLLQRPLELAAPNARLVGLFKPQFEVGREFVGKGGIVRDTVATMAARERLVTWLKQVGWTVENWTESPIRGGDGNREWLFLATNA
jgi:23S rRNA (cytidine1920-2'-O)/16S rRNA (cytidine1409-2'-O)-methyltransferase